MIRVLHNGIRVNRVKNEGDAMQIVTLLKSFMLMVVCSLVFSSYCVEVETFNKPSRTKENLRKDVLKKSYKIAKEKFSKETLEEGQNSFEEKRKAQQVHFKKTKELMNEERYDELRFFKELQKEIDALAKEMLAEPASDK